MSAFRKKTSPKTKYRSRWIARRDLIRYKCLQKKTNNKNMLKRRKTAVAPRVSRSSNLRRWWLTVSCISCQRRGYNLVDLARVSGQRKTADGPPIGIWSELSVESEVLCHLPARSHVWQDRFVGTKGWYGR